MTHIAQFIDYIRLELNYSKLTVNAYRGDLLSWADYATGGKPDELNPESVTTSDLRLWVGYLSRNGCSIRTVRRKASAVRSFYKFLMRRHGFLSNPASGLVLAKLPKDLPVYIRPADTARVIDETPPPDDYRSTLDHLIIDLLYSSGMRCSELTGLLDVNVDTRKGELKVLGKRNKERIIPIGHALCRAIDSYRRLRDSDLATAISPSDNASPLLVRSDGRPLYRKYVYNVVHNTLASEGVHASRLSPHVLRHSFATDMLNAGAPLSSVKMLLGHESLSSTQVYTHVTYSELKHNYQLAHPRALKKGGQNGTQH